MAVVGERSSRHQQIMAFHPSHGALSNHTILAAASVPYYQNNVISHRDAQPDRPIGYGAFGVVW